MSVASSASLGLGPRSLDLRAEYLKRQAAQRQRALDTRRPLARPTVTVREPDLRHIPVLALLAAMPRANTKRRRSRPLGLHIASIGILAGLVAVVIIARLPTSTPVVAAPQIKKTATLAVPTLAKPTQTPLAKAVTAPAKPTDHLLIPSINVNAPVMQVGLTKDGALDAPRTLWQVAHYSGSPAPGDNGTSIIDGHSGEPHSYGVLENLSKLKVGALITYTYVGGRSVTFRVTSSQAYPDVQATSNVLFAPTTTPTLNLISCYGTYNYKADEYSQRWIITSELVQ